MSVMDAAQLLGNLGEFFGAIAVVITLGWQLASAGQNPGLVERLDARFADPGSLPAVFTDIYPYYRS
jgi:hypothetical protein